MRHIRAIFAALDAADVRYVVVGGVAVVLQGHPRMTVDIDLVVDLDQDNLSAALGALKAEGLVPRLPVAAADFADPEVRTRWVEERGLTAFSLRDPVNPLREVDLLAVVPVPFDRLWASSRRVDLEGIEVRVASVEHLLTMKRLAGRPQDLADIAALEALQAERSEGDG